MPKKKSIALVPKKDAPGVPAKKAQGKKKKKK